MLIATTGLIDRAIQQRGKRAVRSGSTNSEPPRWMGRRFPIQSAPGALFGLQTSQETRGKSSFAGNRVVAVCVGWTGDGG